MTVSPTARHDDAFSWEPEDADGFGYIGEYEEQFCGSSKDIQVPRRPPASPICRGGRRKAPQGTCGSAAAGPARSFSRCFNRDRQGWT